MIYFLITMRILAGLCGIGFILGTFLHSKHPIFEKVWGCTGAIILGYGLVEIYKFVVLGW